MAHAPAARGAERRRRSPPAPAGLVRRRMKPGGIAQSAGLLAGAQLLARLIDTLTLLVLARFLTPGDFGLVALASAVLLSLAAMTEVPLTEALVQGRTATQADLSAAFTLSLLRGLLVAALLTALAAPLARLFGEPRLGEVLTTFALIPLAQGCASPAMVHALRALDYRALACSQLCGKLGACGIMLSVAFAEGGVGALVAGLVAGPLVTALSTHLLAPWRFRLSRRGAAGLFHFAGWVSLSRMIFTLNQQSDRFFIGAILGRPQLGLYTMAGDLASLAVRITFRNTFFDSFRSRQIVLIPLPSVKCSRLIFAIVSTISIPCSASDNHRRHIGPNPRSVGSLLDADHPRSGVLIPRRSTNTQRAQVM